MKDEALSDALLRQFLLGKLNEEERQRIESLSASDSAMRERVLSAEQDLIEDYLEDSLSSDDKARFLVRYAQTPAQQRKLRITKTIKDWAVTEAVSASTATAAADVDQSSRPSLWDRLIGTLRLRPMFIAPIAAVIILAVVLVIIWANRRDEHFAIEQEVARLNDPMHLRGVPQVPGALELRPGTLRSDEARELKVRSDLPAAELRLLWIQKDRYPTYRAVIRRVGDDKTITIRALHPEADGTTIRLLLPTHILSRGTYQVHLTGPDGADSPTEEYQFTVGE